MNQRERILSGLIGAVLLLVLSQWGLNRYRQARDQRDQKIAQLTNDLQTAELTQAMGMEATEQMEHFVSRSLPSEPDRAAGEYIAWMLMLMEASGVTETAVAYQPNLAGTTSLYRVYTYRASAAGSFEEVLWLLHAFYSTDYLHRIRNVSLRPSPARRAGEVQLTLVIDVLALNEAAPDQPAPTQPSHLIDQDFANYREPILDRNFFNPPNRPPQFVGSSTMEAVVGRELSFTPQFEDPDGDRVAVRLVDPIPTGVRLDSRSGRISVRRDSVGRVDLQVEARDTGRPQRTVQQRIAVNVVPPPAPTQSSQRPLAFDDATQAFLSALVYSRGDWVAWLTVRTKGEKLELRADDTFEVGSLKGRVVDVTQRFVELEVDDRRFTLALDGNLAAAAKQSQQD